jgi:integrase
VQLGYRTETGPPKSDSSRTVVLDEDSVAVLRTHKARQNTERLAWGSAWVDSGLVFTRENGAALHPEFVTRHFERLARDAGLPPVRSHDLRHGAATLALAGGADLKTVSEMLGHSHDHHHRGHLRQRVARGGPSRRRVCRTSGTARATSKSSAARSHFGPIRARSRLRPHVRRGKSPGREGWAPWGSNPQPAD